MASVVSQKLAPKVSVKRDIIKQEDRESKRSKLHSIISRILELPAVEGKCKMMDSDIEMQSIPDSHTASESVRSTSPALSTSSNVPSESSSVTSDFDRLVCKKVDRVPRRMSQLSVQPGTELVVPVKYNQKMARSFPDRGRSERDQVRRARNTVSARESRAKLRMMNDLLQKQANEARKVNTVGKINLAALLSYSNDLLDLLNLPTVDYYEMWQQAKDYPIYPEMIVETMIDCNNTVGNIPTIKKEVESEEE
ncbi:uncharacterized protein LOC134204485 [Armigeres subalbatus]|uniref:uncharacterized protein LOC134204485 n=1 Tax=Armigeres subalbatus TaxID=124917 RepID=UPI002ED28516